MRCIYCNHTKLYTLNTKQLKCAKCKRKFSPKKLSQKQNIIKCFCENYTINQAKQKLGINYITIQKEYLSIRKYIASFLENQYNQNNVISYDEYIYLPQSKKRVKENIFDAFNFLTFEYDTKIYNLMMPSLEKYKSQFLNDGLYEVYFKEFSKFMMFNKIAKIQKRDNIIQQFWIFFENEIKKYKGISSKNFFYYLKECEFKFNYTKQEQYKILTYN
jgi:hypothetical protein